MKIILINLDKDQDRLTAADTQLKRLGVSYERLSAVDAKDLPADEKRRAVNHFRWWCAIGQPVREGEIACAMSHMKAWEGAVEPICVLEDDIVLDDRFVEVLHQVEARIDSSRPQVVLLSNHADASVAAGGNKREGFQSAPQTPFELRRTSGDLFAEGYVLTPRAAHAIRKANWPLITPCDHWGRWARQGRIELYRVFPTVCSQNRTSFASGINTGHLTLVRDLPFHRWLSHKAKRVVGCTLDRLFEIF